MLKRLPPLRQIRAERYRRSFYEFCKAAWPVIEPGVEYVDGWVVRAVCAHLQAAAEGKIRHLLINIPPRHSKSTITSVLFPAWLWTRDKSKKFLYSSYAERLAIRDSVKTRRLVESDWYRLHFPGTETTSDQNEKRNFELEGGGIRMSVGVNGQGTGYGGDFVICDDPHSVKDSISDTVRESQVDWWFQTMSTRLNDPKTGCRVVIMQRLHEADLSGELLKRGGYCHLNLPAEFEGNKQPNALGWVDPRTQIGELLWPERFGPVEIAALKADLGSYQAAGQLQQRPSPAEGGLVKRNWWKFYDELPANLTNWLISVDAAFNGNADSDFVVMQVWAKTGALYYLVDQERGQWDFPTTKKRFRDLCDRYPQANKKVVERKANGAAIIDSLRTSIPGIIGEVPHESKEARVHAVSPTIESGNVLLPNPDTHPWVGSLIEEFAQFPNGAHDDMVDCTTQALKHLRTSTFQRQSLVPR